MSTYLERRILIADDDPQLHDAYRRVLGAQLRTEAYPDLGALSLELFGDSSPSADADMPNDICYCRQGEDAVAAVEQSLREGRPFAILFLDMRMPPGIDGLETARRVRLIDTDVNIVIVTGYSDHKPAEITAIVGRPERLFYLVKPFDGDELRQLAIALSKRWAGDMDAAAELARRVSELEEANAALVASESRAREAARQDALTGLTNRTGLGERFDAEAASADSTGKRLSVLYLDLDRFKVINDSLGHTVGDQLIRAFARRVRDVTGEDGFAARLGGDEFAVICTKPEQLDALVQRLLDACKEPFTIDQHTIQSSTSIGIAQSDTGRPNLVEVMRRADIALYAAKSAGRGVAREFEPSMERELLNTQRLARDLAHAITNNELHLHYQPLIDASNGSICGVEALLRWVHPEQGPIAPLVFIGVAEKTNLMSELGDWVMRRAFSDCRRWPDLITAINLSPVQLRDPQFVDRLVRLAGAMQINPAMIELEITETVLIEDMEGAVDMIQRLKSVGFRIALDDFGSGFASLAYISHIPFDKLKIDRSFVQDIGLKPQAGGMIRSIVGLAKAMGLTTTAEGVEDEAQREFLEASGCTQMQGFFFHRPLPAEEIEAMCVQPLGRAKSA